MSQPGSLPLHPTARHPHTGAPLRALHRRFDGRLMWPILGASPDDDPAAVAAKAAADAAAAKTAADAKAAADAATAKTAADAKAAADKAAADAAAGGDTGFPANTPVAEMTLLQQVAYHKHQSRKHENRATEWQKVAGDKTPEQVQADLAAAEKLRQESLTDAQRQVEEAKTQTRAESVKEFGADAARVALEFALEHDPEKNDQSSLIGTLDLSKLLTDEGKVDTAKVRALVETIGHPAKGKGTQRHDFGGGKGGGTASTGVASGRSRYQERHGKKADKADA